MQRFMKLKVRFFRGMATCTNFASESKMIVLKKYGKLDELEIVKNPKILQPNLGQAIVQIKFCGVNFADLYTRVGLFQGKTSPKPPFTMGREATGEVVDVGPGDTQFKIGDRVVCLTSRQGLWATEVLVETSDLILLPEEMSFETGAAFFINYITAYCAIFGFGSLKSAQKVFIHSVGGGVGCAATQLAKTVPETIVLGTSSIAKHDQLKTLGVDYLFESSDPNYIEKVINLFPEGLDLILDNRSGNEFQLARKMLSPLGKVAHLGANSVFSGENWSYWSVIKTFWAVRSIPLLNLITSNHGVCGVNIDELKLKSPLKFKQISEEVIQLYCAKKINPCIDSVWKFDEVRNAMGRLISRENIGKILLKPN